MEETRPLEGINVLDFSATVLGPTVTRYLADHGATVVKVESSIHPETTRTGAPHAAGERGIDRSGYFATHNAGKLSLSLNMNKAEAIDVARRLVKWADIVIETFTPGIMARWGLDYEALREIKPDIIMASSSLQGQTGPYASHRGYGMVSAAMTGWFHLTGWPDGEPVGPYSAYSDFIGWGYLLISILAALDHRSHTGEGQYIDHSHVESGAQFLAPALLDYQASGHVASRNGNRDQDAAPHGAYRCRGPDRWCAIAITSREEWLALCGALENPGWANDPRFSTLSGRKANEDELDKLIEAWTVNADAEAAMDLLQGAGVPAGIVANAEDLFRDPQLQHRRAFITLDHPEIGSHQITTAAFRSSAFSNLPRSPAPLMGQHNEHVLRDFLGMSDDEIADLVLKEALL